MNSKAAPGGLDVYFHIGYEKTGTTSIQSFLREHDKDLAAEGVLYPWTLGRISQVKVIGSCKADAKFGRGIPRDEIPEDGDMNAFRTFRREVVTQLRQEILSSGCKTVIVSSEHVPHQFTKDRDYERFKGLFEGFDARFKVIVYLRDQVDLLESRAYTMMVAGGEKMPSFTEEDQLSFHMDYLETLNRLETLFGRDNIIVRRFDRKLLQGGDVVKDFMTVVGLPAFAEKTAPVQNSSLGIAGMKILARTNARINHMDDRKRVHMRKILLEALHEHDKSPRFRIEPEIAAAIRAQYAASNAEVAKRYFAGEKHLFTPKPAADPAGDNGQRGGQVQGLLVDAILDLIEKQIALPPAARHRKGAKERGRRVDRDAAITQKARKARVSAED